MLKFITSLRNNAIRSSTVRWKRHSIRYKFFNFPYFVCPLELKFSISNFSNYFWRALRYRRDQPLYKRKVNTPVQCQLCFTIFCLSKFPFDFPAALRLVRLPDFPRRCVRIAFSLPRPSIASLINDSFTFYCVTVPFNRLVFHHVYGAALCVQIYTRSSSSPLNY